MYAEKEGCYKVSNDSFSEFFNVNIWKLEIIRFVNFREYSIIGW